MAEESTEAIGIKVPPRGVGQRLYRGGVAEEEAEEGTEAIGIKAHPRGVGQRLYRGGVAEEVAEEDTEAIGIKEESRGHHGGWATDYTEGVWQRRKQRRA